MSQNALEILYRGPRFVAVDKPSGMFVHPSRLGGRASGPTCLELLRDQLGSWVYPVHRLDRPTSGVVVFALDPEAAERLSAQFRAHEVGKSYLAVVRGYLPESGQIDSPLRKDCDKADAPPREAVTRYRRLALGELPGPVGRYRNARYTLAEVEPLTGRRHQIRRHMAHISHPVIGDTVYGDGRHNRFIREECGISRLLLHAQNIRFTDPFSQKKLDIHSKFTSQFRILIQCIFPS